MLFRMFLSFDEGRFIDDVELDVHALIFKISTAQGSETLQAFVAR